MPSQRNRTADTLHHGKMLPLSQPSTLTLFILFLALIFRMCDLQLPLVSNSSSSRSLPFYSLLYPNNQNKSWPLIDVQGMLMNQLNDSTATHTLSHLVFHLILLKEFLKLKNNVANHILAPQKLHLTYTILPFSPFIALVTNAYNLLVTLKKMKLQIELRSHSIDTPITGVTIITLGPLKFSLTNPHNKRLQKCFTRPNFCILKIYIYIYDPVQSFFSKQKIQKVLGQIKQLSTAHLTFLILPPSICCLPAVCQALFSVL